MEGRDYGQEQARLQKQQEGVRDDIPIPKDPEVNPEVYRDVEPLIFRGFLTVSAEINETHIVFKSLNHHEFGLVRMMGNIREGVSPPQKFWDLFLAYGVFMVDGQNVLPERERWISDIAKLFGALPLKTKNNIIRHLSELNRRSANAVILTEAYASENYSRFRWAQLRSIDPTFPASTGVPGTERIGLNWAQLLWRALNYYEDLHTQIERDWENAKFIGSCSAGKGIQKVYAQDERRRKTERETSAARKDRLLKHVILGEALDEKGSGAKGVMNVARSVEELATQLKNDLGGEKDWHDQVVAAFEERTRAEAKKRKDDIEALVATNEAEFSGRGVQGSTDFAGLSPEDVRQRILRNHQIEAQSAASRILHPELYDEKYVAHAQKWGMPGEETSDQDPSTALPLPKMRDGKPFRSG